jgi:hypothetical protein
MISSHSAYRLITRSTLGVHMPSLTAITQDELSNRASGPASRAAAERPAESGYLQRVFIAAVLR